MDEYRAKLKKKMDKATDSTDDKNNTDGEEQ